MVMKWTTHMHNSDERWIQNQFESPKGGDQLENITVGEY
jgi:hypothetical protein